MNVLIDPWVKILQSALPRGRKICMKAEKINRTVYFDSSVSSKIISAAEPSKSHGSR